MVSGLGAWGLGLGYWGFRGEGLRVPGLGSRVLGGSLDVVTTYNWAYEPCLQSPKWPHSYRGNTNYKKGSSPLIHSYYVP